MWYPKKLANENSLLLAEARHHPEWIKTSRRRMGEAVALKMTFALKK